MKQFIAKIANSRAIFMIGCGYLFLAFLPLHWPINIGLDPSWSYGITRAAQSGMQFGKDIIFTFGPWGFLTHGVSMEIVWWQIWLFRTIVHLMFWVVFTRLILTTDKSHILYKYLAIFSIGLIYCRGLSHDYELAYTLLALVTLLLHKKLNSFWILLLGGLAGFLSLTKLSLGIKAFLLFLPLLYPKLANGESPKTSYLARFIPNISFLIVFISAFLLAGELFVYPAELFQKSIRFSLFFVLVSLLITIIVTFFKANNPLGLNRTYGFNFLKIIEEFSKQSKKRESRGFWPAWHSLLVISFAISTLLLSLLNRDIYRYLHTALEITSGYSSAMSVIGPRPELLFGLVCLVSILFYCLEQARLSLQNPRLIAYFLSVFLFSWFSFKHGFVRQDGHMFLFFHTLLIVICTILMVHRNSLQPSGNTPPIKRPYRRPFVLWIMAFLTVFYLINPSLFGREFGQVNLTSLSPLSVIRRVQDTSDIYGKYLIGQKQSQRNLEPEDLGDSVRNILGSESVDIIPWDIVRAEKNNLNWQPRPIFQSYAVYTDFLDTKNLESFQLNPRKYLLYDFKSIDGRHPFFDEPKTLRYVLCNYDKVSLDKQSSSSLILQNRSLDSRCATDGLPISQAKEWNVPISIDEMDSGFTTVKVKVGYTLLGKLYKLLFRAPPTYIEVQYYNGSTSRYRFIPENAQGGLVINPLPSSSEMFDLTFFETESYSNSNKVRTLEFSNSNSLLYKKSLALEFNNYSLDKTNS
ncbi:hypothetical protein QGP82_22860 [Leptothoe sp. LEGE 181152]|nr:hypothetical protein [Leptothoe sp. LEGE 181152]